MAAERSATKKVEEMERKLEDANDELEFYRHQVGGGGGSEAKGKGELEELKKSRDALKGTVEGLMEDLKVARGEVEALTREVKRVEQLERMLEEERLHNASLTTTSASQDVVSADEISRLQAKITSLETSLALAQTQFQVRPQESTDEDDLQILTDLRKELRKVKKELNLTQRMVEEAEKERDEFEAEIESIRAEQAKGKGRKGLVDEKEVEAVKTALAEAEKRVEELEGEIKELREAHAVEREESERQVTAAKAKLEVSAR